METLLTVVLVVLVAFWLLRRLLPLLLVSFIARKQRQYAEQFTRADGQQSFDSAAGAQGRTRSSRHSARKEGEITIEKNPNAVQKGKSKEVGEYVSFEEE